MLYLNKNDSAAIYANKGLRASQQAPVSIWKAMRIEH
jgi:hypothetical protein